MIGKPVISEIETNMIFRKLEPYLKTGVSLNKACLMANVPKSTVYDLYKENFQFAEKIDTSKNYLSIVTSNIFYTEIERIKNLQSDNKVIDKNDLHFIQWFTLNHKSGSEEFGKQAVDLVSERQSEIQEALSSLRKVVNNCRTPVNEIQNL